MRNVAATLLLELVTAVSGIIIPRFFIVAYGSSVNGLVSSISQFITYIGLVEAGVGAAAVVELYRPLADGDVATINKLMSGVRSFYFKSGLAFVAIDVLLVVFYPHFVNDQITDMTFIRLMIVVLSLNGIIDYFVLGKYRVLLMADQRNYIISLFQIIGTIVIMGVSIVLIDARVDAILVKACIPVVYILRTAAVVLYCRKKYGYVRFGKADGAVSLGQKNAAFFHQIVGMVCNNTDIVLLTLMMQGEALVEVSVYSVYNYVSLAIGNFLYAVSLGIRSSFGQVIAKKEEETLRRSYDLFEYIFFAFLFVSFTCMGTMLYSFVELYSTKFEDAYKYPRVELVLLFTCCGIIQNLRVPGMTVQTAAGHFKETKIAAAIEAVLNVGLSILLVGKFGIVGVLIGTGVAYLFRTTYILVYHERHFLRGTIGRTLYRIVRTMVVSAAVVAFYFICVAPAINGWIQWIVVSAIVFCGSAFLVILVNGICERDTLKRTIGVFKHLLRTRSIKG